ncbi:hypothetical protein [Chamaesiphon minutus]|uniref:Uncharacterized protein n=1 Tax=Chamaesiphon minutus (strain ATCC 27169 / PCC 6605) TaxID=1173020 RepID=K9UHR7_CHAP6|nr:hypothetical protein [Chamaesiphon minutus]AFY94335.1 hypothetical protein Cha6605_3333 [Chamaesiphon minutus PCC 6605]
MKISSYLLGMGAVASLVALNVTPANAQVGNGSDNGNIFTSITNVGGGGIVGGGEPTYASQSQSAVNQFSQSLTANSVGDAATFDVMNGGAPGPLVAALLPAGVPADGATGKAATNLASTVQGLRSGNGNISATKLNASVGAYNEYIKAYVGEVGPEKALTDAPVGQKALQGVLGQLIQVANQSAPTAEPPSTPPSSTPVPQVPTSPPAPTTPSGTEPTAPPTPR